MAENTYIVKPLTRISRTATRLSLATAAMSLVLLAALHIIKPEFDPSWRMVSEYAIGDHGWVMRLAFLSLAFSCASLFVAIKSQTRTVGGRIGLAVLLATAAAMTAAAVFAIDPITASKDELTTHGNLHALASMIGVPGLPVAAVLISRGLARIQVWSSARRSLVWSANLTWISLLLMVLTLAVMLPQAGGEFGPDVLIGWPNRLMIIAYGAWLMVVAWRAAQLSRQRSQYPQLVISGEKSPVPLRDTLESVGGQMAEAGAGEMQSRTEEVSMSKVIASEFVSLDGVMGAPEKWHFPYFNDQMGEAIAAAIAAADAMLLGRVTYEEWAAYWPSQSPDENQVAGYMNNTPNYVASTTLEEPLEWQNTTLIKGNVAEEITQLKRRPGKDISISGSGALVRSLLRDGLLDELRLMVHPVILGGGKRLFEDEEDRKALKLVDSRTFATGVVYLTYRPADEE